MDEGTSQQLISSSALFAALAHDPKLIAPMQQIYKELQPRLKDDGLPDGDAETVLAALDGMWLWWVLGLRKIDQDLIDRVRDSLSRMTE